VTIADRLSHISPATVYVFRAWNKIGVCVLLLDRQLCIVCSQKTLYRLLSESVAEWLMCHYVTTVTFYHCAVVAFVKWLLCTSQPSVVILIAHAISRTACRLAAVCGICRGDNEDISNFPSPLKCFSCQKLSEKNFCQKIVCLKYQIWG